MSTIITNLSLLFGWLPAWFLSFCLCFIALVLFLLIFKLVAFVMDVIPFL